MSDTNRVRLALIREISFGQQVTGRKLRTVRLTGESLKQDSGFTSSEELRADRQISNVVRTSLSASGGLNFELSHESFDELLAAALMSVSQRAEGTLTMDVNPTDGDTVTIGTTTYRFKDTMAQANDIKLGASVSASQASFVATINGDGVEGTDYYAGTTTPHPLVTAEDFATNDCIITARKAGVDGNSIATTETFTAGTNVFDAATLGTTTAGAGWTATVTVTASTISVAEADDSFNDSGSGFTGISANDWIYASGFTNAVNNGWFKVATASAGKLTIKNGAALVDESAGSSRTIKKCPSIVNGVQLYTYNLEKQFTDLTDILSLYSGMAVNSMSLEIPVDGMITGSFEFLGSKETSKTSSGGNGYIDPPSTIPMATVNDFDNLFENNVGISMINCSLTLSNELRQRLEAGVLGPSSMGTGSLSITGTLQVYFADHTLLDKYLDFIQTALAIALKDKDGNGYILDLPAVTFTNGQRVAGGKNDDVIADMEWSAYMSPTESTTIRISRLDS